LEKLHSAYYDRPETQASIKQWEQDLFVLETAQEAERRDLDQTIADAHETGRIPDRKAEGGTIDPSYPLKECPSASYPQRIEWKVRDSDATVLFPVGPSRAEAP
jgi:hypothetical protein